MELSLRTIREWDADMLVCDIGEPGPFGFGHSHHHTHVVSNYEACSCGTVSGGCWSVVDHPLTPEQQARWDARTCSICGKVGVLLASDFRSGKGADILAGL